MKLAAHVRCREFPSVMELVSYVFCFHGIMCGPFCFYKDYIAFIDGSNYAAPATRNGMSSCRNGGGGGGGGRSLSTSDHLSLRAAGDQVSVSDGRLGNNSHRRVAAPPAPGVSYHSVSVRFIYTASVVSPLCIQHSLLLLLMLQ